MNVHEILRPLVPERKFGSQDDLQNAPRSAQDVPKRVLKSNFFALENRLKIGLVLDVVFDRFWLPKTPPSGCGGGAFGRLEIDLF